MGSSLDFLCECIRKLPMLRRKPHPASKFRAANTLGRLDLMKRSKMIHSDYRGLTRTSP